MQPKIYMKIANVLSSSAEFLTSVVVLVAVVAVVVVVVVDDDDDDDVCVISGRGPWPELEPVHRVWSWPSGQRK